MTQPQPPNLTIDQAIDLALQHHGAGRLQEAEKLYRQVLANYPNHPDALHLLGMIGLQVGQLETASELVHRAIAIDPGGATHHTLLGRILIEQGKIDEAMASFQHSIALDASDANAYNGLGNALRSRNESDQAVAAYQKAIALQPGNAEFHNNLGAIFQITGQLDEAIAAYQKALTLQPRYVLAILNLGSAFQLKGELSRAMEEFKKSLILAPTDPVVQFNVGILELMRGGELSDGLPKLETYRQARRAANAFTRGRPSWDGTELNGKRILLYAEQGAGDMIHVARFIPEVATRGGRVLLTCQPTLTRLFQYNFPDLKVIPHEPAKPPDLPDFDLNLPLLSLPLVLKTTYATIPNHVPYLRADPSLSSQWRQRLDRIHPTKVGLVWAANPTFRNDRFRSMNLDVLKPLTQIHSVKFISLQKSLSGNAPKPSSELEGMQIVDWTDELHDFADTAALIDNLDLVITVDTSVAHLAGAMGKPTWVLLGLVPDWRWLLNRSDSLWYPTLRLFRQTVLNDWQTPIQQVVQALKELINGGS